MGEKIRRHIIFDGRVQGVGFRWHSRQFAQAKGLTGWVQNLDDGTVEMEVQGSEEKIDALVMYLESRDYVLIERMESRKIPLLDCEWEFREKGW